MEGSGIRLVTWYETPSATAVFWSTISAADRESHRRSVEDRPTEDTWKAAGTHTAPVVPSWKVWWTVRVRSAGWSAWGTSPLAAPKEPDDLHCSPSNSSSDMSRQ